MAKSFDPLLVVKGFCMGCADIIPGVSGGTMAFILGIYDRLIDAVRSFDATLLGRVLRGDLRAVLTRPDWVFLIPLVLGILGAIVFFTRVVPVPALLERYPEEIYGLFFGLIAGSILVLIKGQRVTLFAGLVIAAGAVFGFLLVNLVPVATPETWWFIMLAGALAISAMLVPGISGSFILLILGKYATVLGAVGRLDMAILLPFMAGCALGLITFSRLLSWLLHHFHRPVILAIIGLLIGTLWAIWPFRVERFVTIEGEDKLLGVDPILPAGLDGTVLASFGLMAAGFLFVLAIDRLAGKR